MDNLNESILDPVQAVRCDALFNPNDKSKKPVMLKSATDFIMGLLQRFKEDTGLDFEYTEVFMVGSSLGFQYKDTTDIDVDARISLDRSALKGKFHLIPKNIPIPGTAHPVNVYLMTSDDPEFDFKNNCENAYDLLTNKWIKQGRLENSDPIPYEHIAGMSEVFMDAMTVQLDRTNRSIYEINKYMNIDPSKSAITDKERKEAISSKISELIVEKDALRFLHSLVFNFEKNGFEGNSPFQLSIKYVVEERHFSANNLVYKYIDQFGYYDKINEMVALVDETIKKAKESIKPVLEDTPETRNNAEAQSEIVTESYTDDELRTILNENGFESDDASVELLKSDKFVIVDRHDPLDESLETKTEKFINHKIYKASNKVNKGITNTLSFLFAGINGFMISDMLSNEHNATKDEVEEELFDAVQSDSKCSQLISDIRSEIHKDKPDHSKLRQLKKEFSKEVSRIKSEYKEEMYRREHPETVKPHISMKEE